MPPAQGRIVVVSGGQPSETAAVMLPGAAPSFNIQAWHNSRLSVRHARRYSIMVRFLPATMIGKYRECSAAPAGRAIAAFTQIAEGDTPCRQCAAFQSSEPAQATGKRIGILQATAEGAWSSTRTSAARPRHARAVSVTHSTGKWNVRAPGQK